ncbi:hypothetical protein EBT25_13210 [bacterium]|nr:hypothetical protein [bacterium]
MNMPRKPVSPDETSKDRFVRLAQYRTQKVLSAIRVLSHCSNPYNYEYTEEQVAKIFSTVEEELALARTKFTPNQPKKPFTL